LDKEVLSDIKRKIEKLGDKTIGETQTKESFINPMISALGWDVTDFDEVRLEYRHTKKATPVDYALLIDMTPKLYIEAKQLGSNLDDYKWIAQILTYSTMAGVKWAILTDGNHYKLYNTTAEAKLEEKLFFEWKIKDIAETNIDKVVSFLNLLTKEKFKDDEIEIAWQNHFEINKVRKTIKKLIEDKDESLLNLIRKKTKLKRATIVNCLNKLRMKIDRIHLPDVSKVSVEPTHLIKGFTGTIPKRVSLLNETFEVEYWREVLIGTADIIIKKRPEAFYNLADSEIMKMDKHVWLSKNDNVMRDPRRLSNGLFISTGLSANSIYRLIKRLLEGCGYKESDIKISFKD